MRGSENNDNVRERFDEYLRRNRKRRTPERFAILEMALKMTGHFSAETLGDLLRSKGFPISGATVYSGLDILVDFGLLVKQRFGNQACLYEKASVSTANTHHHLICTSCGKIKEVRDPLFSKQIEDKRFSGFSPNYYTLNIYGICASCGRKKKKVQKKK